MTRRRKVAFGGQLVNRPGVLPILVKHHPLSFTTAAEASVQAKDEAENKALAYDHTLCQGLRVVENIPGQFLPSMTALKIPKISSILIKLINPDLLKTVSGRHRSSHPPMALYNNLSICCPRNPCSPSRDTASAALCLKVVQSKSATKLY